MDITHNDIVVYELIFCTLELKDLSNCRLLNKEMKRICDKVFDKKFMDMTNINDNIDYTQWDISKEDTIIFPNDIYKMIFSMLELRDLLNCRLLNKQMMKNCDFILDKMASKIDTEDKFIQIVEWVY